MAEGTVQITRREEPEPTYPTDWVEVVPPKDGNDRVVLWEDHPQHPSGQAFLVPGPPRHVALTPEVSRAIRDGLLRRVPEPEQTLEEYLHQTNTKGDTTGEYHHIAKLPAAKAVAMRPRPKPTAPDRVVADGKK